MIYNKIVRNTLAQFKNFVLKPHVLYVKYQHFTWSVQILPRLPDGRWGGKDPRQNGSLKKKQ